MSYVPRSWQAWRLQPRARTRPTAHQMIALEQPAPSLSPFEPEVVPEPPEKRQTRSRRLRGWAVQVPSGGSRVAILLTVALLAGTAGGGGLLEGRIAIDPQAPAGGGHPHWDAMRADGIPDADLA